MLGELEFTIADVLELIQDIPPPPHGVSGYQVNCPFCPGRDAKRHMRIDMVKNVFNCPRCNTGGGMLRLYSLLNGNCSNAESLRAIRDGLRASGRTQESMAKRRQPGKPQKPQSALAAVDVRDHAYRSLLGRLALSRAHINNLLGRGLTDDAICRGMYKTTPGVCMKDIAASLIEAGCRLEGVPGFFKRNDAWELRKPPFGIMMPALDIDHKIRAIHIRLDDDAQGKFRFLSTSNWNYGCKAENHIHCAGEVKGAKQIFLTEGIMKANIIHRFTGVPTMATIGVGAYDALARVLPPLMENGLRIVRPAYDMDFKTNPAVDKNYSRICEILAEARVPFRRMMWEGAKGFDDMLNMTYKTLGYV